jgi:hypothetical protein
MRVATNGRAIRIRTLKVNSLRCKRSRLEPRRFSSLRMSGVLAQSIQLVSNEGIVEPLPRFWESFFEAQDDFYVAPAVVMARHGQVACTHNDISLDPGVRVEAGFLWHRPSIVAKCQKKSAAGEGGLGAGLTRGPRRAEFAPVGDISSSFTRCPDDTLEHLSRQSLREGCTCRNVPSNAIVYRWSADVPDALVRRYLELFGRYRGFG